MSHTVSYNGACKTCNRWTIVGEDKRCAMCKEANEEAINKGFDGIDGAVYIPINEDLTSSYTFKPNPYPKPDPLAKRTKDMKRFRTDSAHHGMEEDKDGEYVLLKELIEELEVILGDSKKYPEDVECELEGLIELLKKN